MSETLSKSALRVQATLDSHNLALNVVELEESTRTAQQAADAIGCRIGQIAKSLVFRRGDAGDAALVIASGANRVNEKTLKELIGEKVEKADAEFARDHTGFAVGGIPPVGHRRPIETFIDEDLLGYEVVWAAAGTPNAVFSLTPQALVEITGGKIISVK